MAKVRKVKRRQKYQYNKNRKRMRHQRVPSIQCKTIATNWNPKQSSRKNVKHLGLKYDVNEDVTTPKTKSQDIEMAETAVVHQLETDASALREKGYAMPKGQIELITYMMNTYGEDFKAMAKDERNVLQCTWKKFRRMINKFKRIPQQYSAYLADKMEN